MIIARAGRDHTHARAVYVLARVGRSLAPSGQAPRQGLGATLRACQRAGIEPGLTWDYRALVEP